MESLLNIVLMILGIGLLIVVHELGHFLLARRHGVRVDVFSVGFGPPIWRRKFGNTEYRISWVPLGGYVKLAGELPTPEKPAAPDELFGKGAFARLQIFAAGAFINLLMAFPLFIFTNLWGAQKMAPVVGTPGLPETYAGIRSGDRIVEVDGRNIRSMDDYRLEMLGKWLESDVPVKIDRNGEELQVKVRAQTSAYHTTTPPINRIADITPGSVAAEAGLRQGDILEEVRWTDKNGRDEVRKIGGLDDFNRALDAMGGQRAVFAFRRDGEAQEVALQLPTKTVYDFPVEDSMMEPIIRVAQKGLAAGDLGLEEGDRITFLDGKKIASVRDIKKALRGKGGVPMQIRYLRGSTEHSETIRPSATAIGDGLLGIAFKETNVIADLDEESYYRRFKLEKGDRIVRIGNSTGEGIAVGNMFGQSDVGEAVIVERLGKSTTRIEPRPRDVADPARLGILGVTPQVASLEDYPFGARVADGLYEPWRVTNVTFKFLGRVLTGKESGRNFSGPVGIASVTYKSLERGFGNFLWVLGLITVSLGIMNLLPLPLLDGGHMWILLPVEKITGKPPSEKFVNAFNIAGLILFLTLLVFVTVNDFSILG